MGQSYSKRTAGLIPQLKISPDAVEWIGREIVAGMSPGTHFTEEWFETEIKRRWCDELLGGMTKEGLLVRIPVCNNPDHDEFVLPEEAARRNKIPCPWTEEPK